MKYPHARLLIFSKAPVPGQVKTRLIPLLGAEAAARLYVELLDSTIRTALAHDLCPVELWCAPSARHAWFRDCRDRYDLILRQQATGGLGARMSQALCSALQEARHAVLVGADCPTLDSSDLESALARLDAGMDIVLGPALDGGYYLIGLSRHHPFLFDAIAWGTPQVFATTLARCREHGLNCFCLPQRADIDTPDDYRHYCAGKPARGSA